MLTLFFGSCDESVVTDKNYLTGGRYNHSLSVINSLHQLILS